MHIAPAARRWTMRVALAVVVAVGIGYLPATVLRRDPRAAKLDLQLEQLGGEARTLAADNAAMMRDIEGLRHDVSAIEDRARTDLGMVYPDEIVMRVKRDPAPVAVQPSEVAP
jgi:cell division protein FtsB